jgi:UDP-N-acetylglucosamine 2-epimerase (non-hydrolysing)
MIHSGQHYSFEMDQLFFKELRLPKPQYRLTHRSSRSLGHGGHTAAMMRSIEEILVKRRPHAVLVQGDTNTVLAGALVAAKMPDILLGHVEAGLRSYDRSMPEELNRITADHLSDLLFAPTQAARQILLGESIPADRIHVTGNTIVDALRQNLTIARRGSRVLERLGLKRGAYAVMTLHRAENVDEKTRLRGILTGVGAAARSAGVPVIFSVHPRTRARMKTFGLADAAGIHCIEPLGYMDFLSLLSAARIALTDSGGIQEEACVLGVPCVTLRKNTERPETVACGANRIAGVKAASIERAVRFAARGHAAWKQPFGDGRAAERIVRRILKAA